MSILAVASVFLPFDGRAASGTWTAGATGDWNVSTNWLNNIIADGSGSIATMSGSGAKTITLNDTRSIGGLNWNTSSSNGAFVLNGAGTLNFDNGAGVPLIQTSTGAVGYIGGITSNVSGSNGIVIQGNNGGTRFLWAPGSSSLSGGITIKNIALVIESPNNVGLNAIELNSSTSTGAALWFQSTAISSTYQNDFLLSGSQGDKSFVFANSLSSLATINLQGVISQSGSAQNLAYSTGTGNPNGVRFVVSGSNSYTGNTSINVGGSAGPVIVRATNNNALGLGSSTVTVGKDNAALELSGGVTISNKQIELNGAGFQGNGSLHSLDSVNSWEGNVSLGTAANATIGVSSSRLEISGVVSGSSAGGLRKVGAGVLELSTANIYSTGTQILGGTVAANNDQALGSGAVSVTVGTLLVKSGVNLTISSLSLTNDSNLAFDFAGLGLSTSITVSGDQLGSGIYNVQLSNIGGLGEGIYTLLTVSGVANASGFVLASAPDFSGSLDWNAGVLSLTVVPEPNGMLMTFLGVGLIGLVTRRKYLDSLRFRKSASA